MFKKVIALFITAALILCGCTNNTAQVTTTQTDITAQTTSEITDTAATEEIPDNPAPKAQLTDFAEKISDDFYKVIDSDCNIENITRIDGKTIAYTFIKGISENMDSSFAAVLDFETGETKELCIGESYDYLTIAPLNGYFAVMRGNEGILETYDTQLNKISEHKFAVSDTGLHVIHSLNENKAVVIDGSNRLYMVTADDKGNSVISEKTFPVEGDCTFGTVVGMLDEEALIVTVYSMDKDYIYIWETESGKVTELNVDWPAYYTYLADGKLIGINYDFGEAYTYDNTSPAVKKTVLFADDYSFIDFLNDSGSLYFSNSEEKLFSVKRYSVETGCCTAELQVETDFYGGVYSAFEMGDYVIMAGNVCDTTSDIYIWIPKTEEQSKSLFPTLTGESYKAKSSALVKKINEEYGIDVYTGKEADRFFTNYAVLTETNDRLIYNALETIDSICGEFPDGFFEEIKDTYEEEASIGIYLTGRILPDVTNSGSISDAAGFTNTENFADRIIVMDITQGGLDSTFVHELMHVIEEAIHMKSYVDYEVTIEAFSRWGMLNPDDFEYSYSYTDETGATAGYDVIQYVGSSYYEGGEMPVDDVYFVDGYSTTYITEDIARIFENTFFCDTTPLADYFESKNLQLKYAYLCACISEAFDCMNGAEVCWDNGVNPQYTLEYFRENYDLEEYYNKIAVG